MPRVAAIIFHPRPGAEAGPLTAAFARIRERNADRGAAGFRRLAAEVRIVDDLRPGETFGARLRALAAATRAGGLVVLGSGAIPLATAADWRAFADVAGGPPGRALANNRYSADIVAIAGTGPLGRLPDLVADNGLPRWLSEEAGYAVEDLRRRWRLQMDLDSPLDALLAWPAESVEALAEAGAPTDVVRGRLAAIAAISRDARCELLVAGRASSAALAWLERSTASRTRALVEERGFRTRPAGQRPTRSTLGLILDRDGPDALGARLAELSDAAVIDSRVLLAHRFGADERGWPPAEDRFASDLLLSDRIADPWLRALTASARDATIPVVLGGHSLVGPGLRLAVAEARPWT